MRICLLVLAALSALLCCLCCGCKAKPVTKVSRQYQQVPLSRVMLVPYQNVPFIPAAPTKLTEKVTLALKRVDPAMTLVDYSVSPKLLEEAVNNCMIKKMSLEFPLAGNLYYPEMKGALPAQQLRNLGETMQIDAYLLVTCKGSSWSTFRINSHKHSKVQVKLTCCLVSMRGEKPGIIWSSSLSQKIDTTAMPDSEDKLTAAFEHAVDQLLATMPVREKK